MSRVRVTINGHVELDDDLGEWTAAPPDFIREHMNPQATHQPHMKMVLIALTEAIMSGIPVDITADTDTSGYTLTVHSLD